MDITDVKSSCEILFHLPFILGKSTSLMFRIGLALDWKPIWLCFKSGVVSSPYGYPLFLTDFPISFRFPQQLCVTRCSVWSPRTPRGFSSDKQYTTELSLVIMHLSFLPVESKSQKDAVYPYFLTSTRCNISISTHHSPPLQVVLYWDFFTLAFLHNK